MSYDDLLDSIQDDDTYVPIPVASSTPNRNMAGNTRRGPSRMTSPARSARPGMPTPAPAPSKDPTEHNGDDVESDLDDILSATKTATPNVQQRQAVNFDSFNRQQEPDEAAIAVRKRTYLPLPHTKRDWLMFGALIAVILVMVFGVLSSNVHRDSSYNAAAALVLKSDDKKQIKSVGHKFISTAGNFGVELDKLKSDGNMAITLYDAYQRYIQQPTATLDDVYTQYVRTRPNVVTEMLTADESKKDSTALVAADSVLNKKVKSANDSLTMSEFKVDDNSIKVNGIDTASVTKDDLGRLQIKVPVEWTSTLTRLNTVPVYADYDGKVKDPKCAMGCPGSGKPSDALDKDTDFSKRVLSFDKNTTTKNLKMYVTFVRLNGKWQVSNVSGSAWDSYKYFLACADNVSYPATGSIQ